MNNLRSTDGDPLFPCLYIVTAPYLSCLLFCLVRLVREGEAGVGGWVDQWGRSDRHEFYLRERRALTAELVADLIRSHRRSFLHLKRYTCGVSARWCFALACV